MSCSSDGLGDQSEPGPALSERGSPVISGRFERWRQEFTAMGKSASGGGSGWVLLSWSRRDKKLVNQWAADHCHTLAGGQPILALDMVRALLSHGFRRQGRRLRRYLYGCRALGQNADKLLGELTSHRRRRPIGGRRRPRSQAGDIMTETKDSRVRPACTDRQKSLIAAEVF